MPRDVALTVEQRLPGGLDETDLSILRAIRQALPDAGARSPSDVFEHVLRALEADAAKAVINCTEKPSSKSTP
jgi:hypothetical protein